MVRVLITSECIPVPLQPELAVSIHRRFLCSDYTFQSLYFNQIIRQLLLTVLLVFTIFGTVPTNPSHFVKPFCVIFQDENDNPPEFSKSSYIVKILENINAGECRTVDFLGFLKGFSFMVHFMFPLASAAILCYNLHNVLNCSFRMQNVVELKCYIHSHECIQRTYPRL